MTHIGVVGGGAWGTALACLAAAPAGGSALWSRDSSVSAAIANDRSQSGLSARVSRSTPASRRQPILQTLGGLRRDAAGLSRRRRCASVGRRPAGHRARGDLRQGHRGARAACLMPEVLGEVLPGRPIAMLSGPSFAGGGDARPADGGQHRAPSIPRSAATWPARWRPARFRPLLDRRRLRRGAGRRGEERAGDRRRHRRGPRARPQRAPPR